MSNLSSIYRLIVRNIFQFHLGLCFSKVSTFYIEAKICDQQFIRSPGGETHGEFSSINYPNSYVPNLQCIYNFVARQNERVQVTFDDFHLHGHYPNCVDYIDIYSEMQNEHVDLIMEPLGGRYCGSIAPQKRISLHNVLVIVFHTRNYTLAAKGFHGKYEFISAEKYLVGTPAPPGTCGYTIYSKHLNKRQKSGTIYSPTYPGKYPANRRCYYRLLGEKDQRVHINLIDFDLYFGGLHCPYDFIVVHDGDSAKAPIIQKICGLQQKLEIYSQLENLYIEFETNNPPFAEHRGFNIEYTFSKDFVDLSKMVKSQSNVDHMRGTECDIRIRSGKETSHIITSPNFPAQYPLNRTCTYFLDGMQGPEHLEKVVLNFESFSVASRLPDCEDAYVSIYASGQDKSEEADLKHCGSGAPVPIESNGPRLILIFKSANDTRDQGFKANVTFTPGISHERCHPDMKLNDQALFPENFTKLRTTTNMDKFEFDSKQNKEGELNSPRHPSNYPTNTECIYYLFGEVGEEVMLSFASFSLDPGLSEADECSDYVQVITVYPGGVPSISTSTTTASDLTGPNSLNRSVEVKIGHYCKQDMPGPIASGYGSNIFKIVFHSDAKGVSTGFKAKYRFVRAIHPLSSELTDHGCGGRIEGQVGGVISFPHNGARYGKNTYCSWVIRARPGYKVLLQVDKLLLEGSIEYSDKHRAIIRSDCGPAVLRVYTNEYVVPNAEICGAKKIPTLTEFQSENNYIRVSFITRSDSDGNEGFMLSWTEISKADDQDCITGFRCTHNNYCIDSRLRCNEYPNCGEGDTSDEAESRNYDVLDETLFPYDPKILGDQGGPRSDRMLILVIVASGFLGFVLFVLLCVLIARKEGRKRRRKTLNGAAAEQSMLTNESNHFYIHHSFS